MSYRRQSTTKMSFRLIGVVVLFQICSRVSAFAARLTFRTKPALFKLSRFFAEKRARITNKILGAGRFFLLGCLLFLPFKGAFADLETPQEWQHYLEAQLRVLKEEMSLNPEVIQSVARANQGNAHFTQEEIVKIDQQWRQTEGVDLFIVSLITNDLADKLKEFQKKHRSLVEIFITDQRGLLIASTNKTSDFYQADEDWWQKAFQLNNPDGFFGSMEYDESALVEGFPFYLVITDERHAVIGILKAVCGKNKILKEGGF